MEIFSKQFIIELGFRQPMAFSSRNGSLKYKPKFFLPIDHRYRNVWNFFYLWIINSKKKKGHGYEHIPVIIVE